MTDPIADMLTRIRNASQVKKQDVFIPFSKIKLEIVKILKKEGFINGFSELKPNSQGITEDRFGGIVVSLKYNDNQSAITSIDRISKPGRRVYVSKSDIPRVLNGLGLAVISTSRGIITNKEAKNLGLGGEVICEIY